MQYYFKQLDPQELVLELQGIWRLDQENLGIDTVLKEISDIKGLRRIIVNSSGLQSWDSSFVSLIYQIVLYGRKQNIEVDLSSLPEGSRKILQLGLAVKPGVQEQLRAPDDFIYRLGTYTIDLVQESYQFICFIGETALSFVNFIKMKAQYRTHDLFITIQQCGVQALPIVTLISLLIGLILAFVGNTQLAKFGAEIYVANLVGLGMTREMGAMMTAVIMAGHSGAAFAAQIGTMKVNREIDALSSFGFSINEFLILPRVIALVLMVPLLAIYADILGIIGGGIVCNFFLDIKFLQYFQQVKFAVGMGDVMAGLCKSFVFGVLIAIAGCLRGMECGSDASAVGRASTYAVVTSLVLIVVSDAILTVIYDILGV